MGICKYCGKPAGLFHSAHKVCEEEDRERQRASEDNKLMREKAVQDANGQIVSESITAIKGVEPYSILEAKIIEIEQAIDLPKDNRNSLLVRSWEQSVDSFLEDGVLDASEENRLAEFRDHFGLSQADLDTNGALTKTAKAGILRDVLNGKIPQRFSIDGSLPINFQKNETVIWAFRESKYLEDKTRRQYVGGSQGVSIRVMKGVYYRVGAFKAHPIETTERTYVDSGWVAVTNKNIYFAGPHKSLRVPYLKIVSFEPFSDGIGIMRDAATAKPQIFVTEDGWFTYNLVTNLARM